MSHDVVSGAVDALGGARPRWILLALLAVVVAFVAHGELVRTLIGPVMPLSRATSLQVALVAFGLGGIMPASPAEGVAVAASELGRRGVQPTTAAKALVIAEWERFITLAVIVAVDLVVVVVDSRALGLGLPPAVAISASTLVVVWVMASLARRGRVGHLAEWVVRWWHERGHGRPADRRPTAGEFLGTRGNRFLLAAWAATGRRGRRRARGAPP